MLLYELPDSKEYQNETFIAHLKTDLNMPRTSIVNKKYFKQE